MISIKRIPVGDLQANCYVVWCDYKGEALVIDPGAEDDRVIEFIKKEHLNIKYIVLTHGHYDHIGGLEDIEDSFGADILIHKSDAQMLTDSAKNLSGFFGVDYERPPADMLLNDNDTIEMGRCSFKVIHTPGHTPGSICLEAEGVLFTGDTIFKESIGRTDLPGGDFNTLTASIKGRLMNYSDNYVIYPGHGEPSTIGHEKKNNPYM